MATSTGGKGWALGCVPFMAGAITGSLNLDTGAEVTAVAEPFVLAAGLTVRPHGEERRIRTAGGGSSISPGTVDLKRIPHPS